MTSIAHIGKLQRSGFTFQEISKTTRLPIGMVLTGAVYDRKGLAMGPAKLDLPALLEEHGLLHELPNFELLVSGVIRDLAFRRKLEGEYAECYGAILTKLSEPFAHLFL